MKDNLQSEYDKLKQEDEEKSVRLQDLTLQMDRREQAKQDLKGKDVRHASSRWVF